jgi:hypothetical protein
MQKITDRTYDYTGPDGCYSLDVERALIWDSMTDKERLMLRRYDELLKINRWFLTNDDKKEILNTFNWCVENDIDLSLLPR